MLLESSASVKADIAPEGNLDLHVRQLAGGYLRGTKPARIAGKLEHDPAKRTRFLAILKADSSQLQKSNGLCQGNWLKWGMGISFKQSGFKNNNKAFGRESVLGGANLAQSFGRQACAEGFQRGAEVVPENTFK